MSSLASANADAAARIFELEARLREAEETLDAIRLGEVDAVIMGGPNEPRVYTIETADRPYRVLIEQMQEGAVTLSAEGTVLYCNRHLAELLATPQERVTGQSIFAFVSDERRPFFERLLSQSGRGGGKGESVLVAGSGISIPVYLSFIDLPDESERLICGIVTDLTRQEQQKVVEEGLEIALDASDMGSWDLDLKTQLARRSTRHDAIFGHDPAAAWGLPALLDHVDASDRPIVRAAFDQAVATGLLECEVRIRRAGEAITRWIRIKGRTYYHGVEAVRMVGVLADITDQRQLEDQLRQAQKMEAVGQLTGGLAHDFNNLLTVILGNLDQARKGMTDEKLARQIDHARQAAERGAGLTQQLLAFSRRQSLQPRAICVNHRLASLGLLVQRVLGDDVELTMVEGEGLWHCEVDPNQLESALLNLAINARDAMPKGGMLTVSTANIVLTAAEAEGMAGISAGRFVRVTVADTGEGMSEDTRSRVFEPFFTTKDVGKGSGLGLSMVYGFVRQSNGHVSIESKIGCGTAVHLYLPWAEQETMSVPDGAVVAADTTASMVILVVEDDADVRRLAVQMVAELGHAVLEAQNGPEALALLARHPEVGLLFSDIVMPKGMSGIDLARDARRRRPDLPVLLTSGFTSQSIEEKEGSEVDFELIRKPYRQDELAKGIARAMTASQTPPEPASLQDMRVLVVEDEPLIAMVLEDMLLDLGCAVVGPYAAVSDALAAVDPATCDAALLDVNIRGGVSYPVAQALRDAKLPFAFMSGQDAGSLPEEFRSHPNLAKPYTPESLESVVRLLSAQR